MKKTFAEYWKELGRIIEEGDTITWRENIITHCGWGGTKLSEFNVDSNEETIY